MSVKNMIAIKKYLKAVVKGSPILMKLAKKILAAYAHLLGLLYSDANFAVYRKNFLELPDCADSDNSLYHQYKIGNLFKITKPLGEYYQELNDIIANKVKTKEGYSLLRIGDGELNFIRGIMRGNTSIRHYTKESLPTLEYLALFSDGLLRCDSIHAEMYKDIRRHLSGFYKKKIYSDIPLECVYGLIASRELLKSNYRLGLIGSDKKIALIKKLLNYSEYTDYIGRKEFQDYISVPEKGSANDVLSLADSIKSQLKSDIDIYLVGIGIAKLVILPMISQNNKAVFLDVGCGISALAGLTSNDRPYFADWLNFRMKDYDYGEVDVMDASFNSGKIKIL